MTYSYQKDEVVPSNEAGSSVRADGVLSPSSHRRGCRRRWLAAVMMVVGVSMAYLCSSSAYNMTLRANSMLSVEDAGGLWGKSAEASAAKAQAKAEKNDAKAKAKAAKEAAKTQAKQEKAAEKAQAKEEKAAEKAKAKEAKHQAKEQYLAEHPEVAAAKEAAHEFWKEKGKEYKDYWKDFGNQTATKWADKGAAYKEFWSTYANETAAHWAAKGEEYKAKYSNMTDAGV